MRPTPTICMNAAQQRAIAEALFSITIHPSSCTRTEASGQHGSKCHQHCLMICNGNGTSNGPKEPVRYT